MTDATWKLALRLSALEAALRDQKAPQLAYSAMSAGAITVTDELDRLRGSIGVQFDGSTMAAEFVGPDPLEPTPAVLSVEPGSLRIRWDGLWAGGGVLPMNFTRTEIHISETSGFAADTADTLFGTFETPRGGEQTFAMPPGVKYVRFVARNLAGARGPASVESSIEVMPLVAVDVVALQAEVDAIPDQIAAAKQEALDGSLPKTPGSVTETYIADDAITTPKIAANAVTADEILAGAVIAGKIATDAVLAANIKAGEIIAGKLAALSVIAGNIAADAVTANTIAAGAIEAGKLAAGAVIAGNIAANAVTATTIAADAIDGKTITGATIYAGDTAAEHVSISNSGIEIWTPIAGAEDTTPQKIASFGVPGPEGDYISLTDGAGNVVVSISGSSSNFGSVAISGDDTRDPLDVPYGLSVGGSDLADLLWGLPRGLKQKVYQTATASWSGITTELGIHEISWMHIPGRTYRVKFYGGRIWNPSYDDSYAQIAIRYSDDGTSPTPAHASHGYQPLQVTMANRSFPMPMMETAANFIPGATEPKLVRCLLTVAKSGGTGSLNVANGGPIEATVEDIGPDVEDTWLVNTGGTGGGATATPKSTYTSSWYASTSESYRDDASTRTEPYLYQGLSSPGSYNGNQRSMAIFGGTAVLGEVGKTMATALAGATIEKVEVRLVAAHWGPDNGGTAVIRPHNSTTLQFTTPATSSKSVPWSTKSGEKIIDITSIASAAIRGIAIGPGPSSSLEYYGYFYDHTAAASYRPWIRVTYTR